MANIKIGGRVESVATDGIVTGANAVYDDRLSKDQQTINQELYAGIGTREEILEILTAEENGTAKSAVSTGEKYTWNSKQDAISDLAAIRSGAAAGATAYQLPATGIPLTTLSTGVQTSLGKADSALQSVALGAGTTNGTMKLTVDGVASSEVAVPGLGSLAFLSSLAYGDLGYTVGTTTENGNYADAITLDGTKPIHVIALTGNVSGVSLTANPAAGHSTHVLFTAASETTVLIAHNATSSVCPDAEDLTLTVPAGGYAEVDFLNANSKIYVRGV